MGSNDFSKSPEPVFSIVLEPSRPGEMGYQEPGTEADSERDIVLVFKV